MCKSVEARPTKAGFSRSGGSDVSLAFEAEAPKRGRGRPRMRPSIHDPGMLDKVCDELIVGKSIRQACEPEDMPNFIEIYREMHRDQDLYNAIARAREAQQEFIADDIVEQADLATPEDHNVVKLRIWARQWRAAKLAPKKYGDKQVVDITQNINIAVVQAEQLMQLSQRAKEVIDVTPTVLKTVEKPKRSKT